MDRRKFLGIGSAALATLGLSGPKIFAQEKDEKKKYEPVRITCEGIKAGPEDLAVRFLGTGAAGWKPGSKKRHHSSVLLDGKILIDMSPSAPLLFPEGFQPEVVFYTHSHPDHYNAKVAVENGVKKVYLSESWLKRAKENFRKAAKEVGRKAPKIVPLKVGEAVEIENLVITALPANHATGDYSEQALIYLIEKGTTAGHLGVRLLYATDTGGITGIASRISGIDSHLKTGRAITGIIMESTMGAGKEQDYRIFNHSSLQTVTNTVHMLMETGRYLPPEGQPAYITHMSTIGWAKTQAGSEALVEPPLRPAYDGLETVFRPVD